MGPVATYTWHGANPKIVMAIWKMARDQHVFYRSKKRNRVSHTHPPTPHTHSPPFIPCDLSLAVFAVQGSHLNMNQTEIKRQLNKLHKTNISPSSSQSSLSMESAKSNQTQGECVQTEIRILTS